LFYVGGVATMIKTEFLCKSYNNTDVLTDICLNINKGEIFGIVGQSGAGKSTLLRCINGLETFDKGKMLVNGTDLALLSEQELRLFRRKIGMIFQNFALLNRKTVLDNVRLPMECWNFNKTEMKKKAEELLEMVGLTDKIHSLPHELSGGQKQRVAIARALTLEPDILLCDEATSALDPSTTKSILELLTNINRELGITIVVVTHEMAVIKSICDRMAIITDGRIVAKGAVQEIFMEEPPALLELIGRQEIKLAPGKSVIKLSVKDSDIDNSFIYNLAVKQKIDFSIVSANIEQYSNKSFGHLYLSVMDEYADEIISYCKDNGMTCSMVNANDYSGREC
jgi:D-methionine transport system ATP-binding protein